MPSPILDVAAALAILVAIVFAVVAGVCALALLLRLVG